MIVRNYSGSEQESVIPVIPPRLKIGANRLKKSAKGTQERLSKRASGIMARKGGAVEVITPFPAPLAGFIPIVPIFNRGTIFKRKQIE